MASQETLQERKRQLALKLDASRELLLSSGRDVRRRINPVRRVRRHFKEHPMHLFAAVAAGATLLTALLPRRRKKAESPNSSRFLVFGWLLGAAKPALRYWLLNRTKTYLQLQPDEEAESKHSLLGP